MILSMRNSCLGLSTDSIVPSAEGAAVVDYGLDTSFADHGRRSYAARRCSSCSAYFSSDAAIITSSISTSKSRSQRCSEIAVSAAPTIAGWRSSDSMRNTLPKVMSVYLSSHSSRALVRQ